MKTSVNIEILTNIIRAVLVFSVIVAFLMAGYYIATGNFHQYVNL